MNSLSKEETRVASDKKECFLSQVQIGEAVVGSRAQREVSLTTDSSGGKQSSGADKYERLRTGEGASFPGVSEFPVKKNPPKHEGARGKNRVTFEKGGKLCSSC